MYASITLLSLLSAAPAVLAWGNLGHQTIAYIATDFVTSETKSWAQKILGDTTTSYLANYATWADTFKYTSAGSFSEPFHFIDALDSPPETCNVNYDRDCGDDNCVVSAIVNYTSLVVDSSASKTTKNESLMFLIHFLGDIHQPLHDENLDVGGNDIDVKYGSTSTNLHHAWDTNMPEDYAGGYSLSDARTWATALTTSIKSGTYKSQAAGWLDGISIDDSQTSATSWASDANAYVCSTVMPDGISSVENKDLSGSYYNTALPVIKLQFAKAGYRLAAWLNLLATGDTGL